MASVSSRYPVEGAACNQPNTSGMELLLPGDVKSTLSRRANRKFKNILKKYFSLRTVCLRDEIYLSKNGT
jgi:hypothetical protein